MVFGSSIQVIFFQQMLNHSLDDIEVFVSLIQKSAEATRELTVRQSKKKSSKKGRGKASGSGIMELRARLPPKEQFSETFQKFRFCFNLLVSCYVVVITADWEVLLTFCA